MSTISMNPHLKPRCMLTSIIAAVSDDNPIR